MSGEQQLERSILERKERDELHAIAAAMALKLGSRARKAEIIDQILTASGVTVAEPTVSPGEAGSSSTAGSNGTEAETAASNGSSRSSGRSTRARSAKAGGVSSTSGEGSAGGDSALQLEYQQSQEHREGPAGLAGGDASATGLRFRATVPDGASGRASVGNEPAGGEEGGLSSTVEVDHSSNGNAGSDRIDGSGKDEPAGGDRVESASDAKSSSAGRSRGRASEAGARSPEAAGSVLDATPGGGRPDGSRSKGSRAQPGNSSAEASANGNSSGDGPRGSTSTQPGSSGDGHAGEPGNRRSRRRRGRDRQQGRQDPQGSSSQDAQYQGELVPVDGHLDLREEGYGFLRTRTFLPGAGDVYVSVSQVRRFALRKGDYVTGACRPASSNEKYPALLRVDSVSGLSPDEARDRPRFEDLTPLFPDERLKLEMPGDSANMTSRIVDLLSPIGKGQRGLIVSPPKAGKTSVLKQVAHSIESNNPEVHLIVLLVDERPEEVTDMRRSVKGEVVASTFDRPAEEHTAVAEMTIEKARRMVEVGKDVVIVLDGITRLARAYNLAQPATGRIMSGGVDSGALYPPKKFFGAARNIEEGGSLTILATALVETGSRMDEVIFEEFKGTGNMELRLDRRLAERRIYPAIDVNASSTRHEELLFDRSQLQQVWKLRRVLNALAQDGSNAPGLELLMDKIRSTSSNDEFLAEIAKGPNPTG